MKTKKLLVSILIGALLAAGFYYRMYLGTLTDPNPVFDQRVYLDVADSIADGHLASECCTHGPGYPLFLAGIFTLFGKVNLTAVRTIQMLLDTVTAWLIFVLVLKNISFRAGFVSFILYLFNPFTSSYTGLILAETLGCFLLAVILTLLDKWRRKKSHLLSLALGVLLAYFAITKYGFFYVSVLSAMLFTFSLFVKKFTRHAVFFILSFIAVFLYPIAANKATFQKFSVMPPRGDTATLLYASMYMGRYHELFSGFSTINRTYTSIMVEYYDIAKYHPEQLKSLHDRNLSSFLAKFRSEWPQFLTNTARNIVWMWDKPYRVVNEDPLYPKYKIVFQIYNAVIIALAFRGFYRGFFWTKNREVWAFSGLFILFVLIGMPMLTNETRITIVLYPMLVYWLGGGLAGTAYFKKSK